MAKALIILVASVLCILAVEPTTYTYKTVGSLSIPLDVYVPDSTQYDKYPILFAIHGGGYIFRNRSQALSDQELAEALSRGWVVVAIDYRLAPGVLLYDIIQDVQDAYDWVRNELTQILNVDTNRITVWGGSAGGGLAVLTGYKITPRPNVIIAFYPACTNFTETYVYNPKTPVDPTLIALANSLRQPVAEDDDNSMSDPRAILFFKTLEEEKTGWLLTTRDPNEPADNIAAMLKDLSAVYHVDANYPPTYLSHSLNDSLVPYQQSVEMAAQLNATKIPYVLDLVPGVNHAYDFTDEGLEAWHDHILPAFNFAEEHMIGKAIDKVSM